jgi:hypothetical protein
LLKSSAGEQAVDQGRTPYLGLREIPPGLLPKKLLLLCWMILALMSPGVHAQRVTHAYDSNLKIVRAILAITTAPAHLYEDHP